MAENDFIRSSCYAAAANAAKAAGAELSERDLAPASRPPALPTTSPIA
jgi:hypothetical protein